MRLLLDENIPKKLKKDLAGHDVYTVQELRRDGNEDEEVLQFLIDFNFDALITYDKNLRFQQNFTKYPTPVIVLDTYTNAYPILKSIIPPLLEKLLSDLQPGATVIKPR